jgi:carbamoylphosphate synthase large subunit
MPVRGIVPRILMIGGNRSTIGSIRALRAAGFEVAVAEKLPRQYALAEADIGLEIAPADVPSLFAAIHSLGGVNGIVGINETAMSSAAELQQRLGLIGLPSDVIRRTESKLAQRQCWAHDPELLVPYKTVETAGELRAAIEAVGGLPVIVKPDLSHGGSRGVSLVNESEEIEGALAFAREQGLPGSQIIVERALCGPQFSAELMVKDAKTSILAIGRKVKSAAPYRVDLAIAYPGVTDAATLAAIERVCSKATALLGITRGPGHFEFVLTEDGPRPIELAARCGGSITPDLAAHVSGYHPIVEAARLACGLAVDDWRAPARRGAVLMFIAFPPCAVRRLEVPEWIVKHPAVVDIDYWLPADRIIQPIRWTSQRTGYIGLVAEDGQTALTAARKLAANIRVETVDGHFRLPLTIGADACTEEAWCLEHPLSIESRIAPA